MPSWIGPFTGLSPRCFGKLVAAARREQAADRPRGRPWSLSLEDRVLLVTAYWRTNLTMRQLAPLFGISKPAADRIIDHLGPLLALRQRSRFRRDTVLIVDGTVRHEALDDRAGVKGLRHRAVAAVRLKLRAA